MEHGFWHKRWAENRIGFHQQKTNRWLAEYWSVLGVSAESDVLVPLCGKSQDMLWLREQGHGVVGVELSDLACRDFFAEQQVDVDAITRDRFHIRERDGIRLLAGDFFDLHEADIPAVKAIYDRAALIALPPSMRESYAKHIKALTQSGDRMLLVTLEYDNDRDEPPFAVSGHEVRSLFEPSFTVEVLDGAQIEGGRMENEREVVYLLTRQ